MSLKDKIVLFLLKRELLNLKKENPDMWKALEGKRTIILNVTNTILGIWLAAAQAHVQNVPEIPGALIAVLAALGVYTRVIAKPQA